MTIHHFNIFVAQEHGVIEAVILENFRFWISKNKAEGEHNHDERTWTYNSVKAMADLFPYLSTKQIRAAIENLVQKGVLLKGNFNKNAWDRTTWFAFAQEGEWIHVKGQISSAQQGKSLTTTDINQIKEQADAKKATPKKPSKPREKKEAVTLQTWLALVKAKGEQSIPETDPLYAYAEEVQLPIEYVNLAWKEFKHRHTQEGAKLQKDWRAHFRDAVRRNWLKLWWYDKKNGYSLTTAGSMAELFHAAREKEAEAA